MRVISIILFVRALRGNPAAAQLLMEDFQPPLIAQQLLARVRNVEVQSILAQHTLFLPKLVFHFDTVVDQARFEQLCVRSAGQWHEHMFEQPFRAKVVKSIHSDVRGYSL